MATAIIKGLIAQNGDGSFINVYDLSEEKLAEISKLGVNTLSSSQSIVKDSDIIVLAVKPQNYAEVLDELKEVVSTDKTFVSIAAGISIAYVQNALGCNCPVVRVMPNTPQKGRFRTLSVGQHQRGRQADCLRYVCRKRCLRVHHRGAYERDYCR